MTDNFIYPEATAKFTAGAYAAGQIVGGNILFPIKGRTWDISGGLLLSLSVLDNDLEGAPGTLYLFQGKIGNYADRTLFDNVITYADMKKNFYEVTMGTFSTYAQLKRFREPKINTGFQLLDNVNTITGLFRTSGTPSYALGKELCFILGILPE